MTTTHQTNLNTAAPFDPSRDPLRVLDDQPERWHASGRNPMTWDTAREIVALADGKDGARTDLGVGDLSTWVAGPRQDGIACLTSIPMPGRPRGELVPMRASAFAHLCAAIGAPPRYLLGLPAKLATACLSTGTQAIDVANASKLIRLAGGEARAVASDRYAPLDNALVLDTIENTLRVTGRLRDVRVTDLAVGPTMALRLTIPNEDKPVKVGDIVSIGLDVLNGEILNRSASITPITHRLVCLNGMRRADASAARRFRHVGDPARLREAFTDALPVVLAEAEGLRERMAVAVDRLIDDVIGEIAGLSAFGLTATTTRNVARDLYADRGISLPENTDQWSEVMRAAGAVSVFDVANAMTHHAQNATSTDGRIELESAGAAYLYRGTR